jgi:BirA family biotin operon repressor/biotin-[acetyl-CoA-carboxylase] ligase
VQPQSLSLVAGLALVDAVDAAVPAQPLMLKWPNDLLLLGKKLSGILLERSGDRVVIGFGVNLASAPSLPDRECASLSGRVSPQAFAPILAGTFDRLLQLWRASPPGFIAQAWLARAHPLGTELKVHSSADQWVSGRFDGIEPDGALRLRTADNMLDIIRAADIEL